MQFGDFNGDGRLDFVLTLTNNNLAGYGTNNFFFYLVLANAHQCPIRASDELVHALARVALANP